MGVKALMSYLSSRAAVTPVTPEKTMGLQENSLSIKAVTLVTPVTSKNTNSREFSQTGPLGEAVNDPASAEPNGLVQPPAPAPDKPAKRLKFLDWADGWIGLDRAYQRHHWSCPQCTAAGRGANYGLRCGVGAALYRAYSDASEDRSALDW